jgi:hypothetical protein
MLLLIIVLLLLFGGAAGITGIPDGELVAASGSSGRSCLSQWLCACSAVCVDPLTSG